MTDEKREQRRRRARERYAELRAEWIREKGGACQNCGSTERLEFHHRDPREKVTHYLQALREPARQAELAKCDLLCRYCHSRYSAIERGADPALYHSQLRNRVEWMRRIVSFMSTGVSQ